jgi:CBS domain containing-hemolysin-like protein
VTLAILLILLCMLGAAFFSGIETGMISIHPLRLRHFVREGRRWAKTLQGFFDSPDRLIGTTLVGTNLCVVVTTVVSDHLAVHLIGDWGEPISTVLTTVVLLAFCEYLPKAWFHSDPIGRTRLFAGALTAAEKVLHPVSTAIIWITRLIVPGPASFRSAEGPSLTREDFKLLTREGEKDGVFTQTEGMMIHRVFDLSRKRARDIMVPREHMTFVYTDTPLPDFLDLVRASRRSRMPVFDRQRNEFVGIINVYYVVSADPETVGKTIEGFVRRPLLIAEDLRVDDTLPRLRRSRQPMCLVVNAQSEVTGLLTTEDILREIVGELKPAS